MFERVTIAASDPEAARRFYETVLATLGGEAWADLAVVGAESAERVTRRLHIAFFAPSRERVDAFWRAGVEAGHRDDGAPGPRPQYGPDYYGGFLLDPDGNSAEAVHRDEDRVVGRIDHLWIRVTDLAAARAAHLERLRGTAFALGDDTPQRVQFLAPRGSFSLVAGDEPTEHYGLAVRRSGGDVVEVATP